MTLCGSSSRGARLGNERSATSSFRLGKPNNRPGKQESGNGEDEEGEAPGEGGNVTGDGETEAGADQLAAQDEAVDASALRTGEIIAHQRSDARAGRRGHSTQEQARK